MRLHILLPLALLAAVAPQGARAQTTSSGISGSTVGFEEDSGPTRHFMFNVGGGTSFPISDAGDRFKTGGGFQLGAGFQFKRGLGIFAEYAYTAYDVQSDVLSGSGLDGNHYMQYGDLNALVDLLPRSRFGIYLTGGPGLYYRKVEVTEFAGAAVVPYCDPWLYFCYTDVVPVSQIIGSRSSTDFGLNGGVGLTFKVYGDLRLYLEGRYHYIFGPTFTDRDNVSRKADGQYIPLMFGLRY